MTVKKHIYKLLRAVSTQSFAVNSDSRAASNIFPVISPLKRQSLFNVYNQTEQRISLFLAFVLQARFMALHTGMCAAVEIRILRISGA